MSADSLSYQRKIGAARDLVYRAFTRATGFRDWLCDGATTQAEPDGRIVLWWNDGYVSSGVFKKLEPDTEIVFTWQGRAEPQATTVTVKLNKINGGTDLTLVHSGLGSGEAWETAREEFDNGWKYGLENLASTLETGKDLRFYNRPMLGILISDFNAEIAARENIPVTAGVRLDGTVEGMGAEKAGLQQGDVITVMDGKEIASVENLTGILGQHQAGDTIQVNFYRGSEMHEIQMALSGRPVPDISWDPGELADRVEKMFAEMHAELLQAIDGASEAEMEARPAADEWNAKETIAHLYFDERGNNTYIADLIGDHERWDDDFGSNILNPLQALIDAYPSTAELIEALKVREAETVALLRRLPESFTRRKAAYWRMADGLLNAPYHTRSHIPQIKAAIESAR